MSRIHGISSKVLFAAGLALAISVPAAADVLPGPNKNGLVLWLKADSGFAQDGSTWTDQSGKGHDATAVPGHAPGYLPAGLNGLPVAQFSGNQAMSISGQVLNSQAFTIVAVVTDTSSKGTGFREILSNWTPSTGSSSIFLGALWTKATGKMTDRIRFTDAIGGEDQGQTGVGKIKDPSNAFILTGLSAVNDANVHFNAHLAYDLGSSLPARDLSESFYLGDQGSLGGEFWEGDIAEILVYDKALSKKTFDADVAYLNGKWQTQP